MRMPLFSDLARTAVPAGPRHATSPQEAVAELDGLGPPSARAAVAAAASLQHQRNGALRLEAQQLAQRTAVQQQRMEQLEAE